MMRILKSGLTSNSFIRLTFCLFLVISKTGSAQHSLIVKGNAFFKDSTKVTLQYQENGKTIIDSARIKNNEFEFRFSNPEAKLGFLSVTNRPGSKVFLLDGDVEIIVDTNKVWNSKIIRSPGSIRYEKVNKFVDSIRNIVQNQMMALNRINRKTDSLAYFNQYTLANETGDLIYSYKLAYIKAHSSDIISLFYLNDIYFVKNNEVQKLLDIMDQPLRDHSLYSYLQNKYIASKAATVGNSIPVEHLTNLAGEQIKLNLLSAKYVLLNFWGTWCGPCIKEMPDIVKLYNAYDRQYFDIVSIAYEDASKTNREIQKICQKYLMVWHNTRSFRNAALKDPKDITRIMGISIFPTNVLVDSQKNKIIWVGSDITSVKELDTLLQKNK